MAAFVQQLREKQSQRASAAEAGHSILHKDRSETESQIFDLVDSSVDALLQNYSTIRGQEAGLVKDEVKQDILKLITRIAESKGMSIGNAYKIFLKNPNHGQLIEQAFTAAINRPAQV